MSTRSSNLIPFVLIAAALLTASRARGADDKVFIRQKNYHLAIDAAGFRFALLRPDGTTIAPAHAISGLRFGGHDAAKATLRKSDETTYVFDVTNTAGQRATVEITPGEHHAKFSVRGGEGVKSMALRTAGVSPAFGLGDQGALGRESTELTGFSHNGLRAMSGGSLKQLSGVARLISNFVVFPKHNFAEINFDPGVKVVRLTEPENAQGTPDGTAMPAMYYFFGDMPTIYRDYLDVRNREGFKVYPPRYEWFGVGWEAWGALAWDTNQQTVTENVDRYLAAGYPLRWMVVGSGFWPRDKERFHATTSFGLWDEKLYPDPRAFIARYRNQGLKFIIGLRIAFITDGPFAEEGVRRGAFIRDESGEPKVFNLSFPRRPAYLLDATRSDAVRWYVGLCEKWLDFGVDGFKEDLFGYHKYTLRDDKLDAVNAALIDRGAMLMGRNGYAGSAMQLHRIEDFNYDQPQDRGPINCLSLAYSGFSYCYPDVSGGTISQREWGGGGKAAGASPTERRMKRYLMRNVQFASVTPSMAMGYGPWNAKDGQVEQVALGAAKLHDRLQPYIHSAAVDAYRTGYPHTMTPLPIAFPNDPEVYGLENAKRRGYQWMLGPSLLATPLYGDDYDTADTRDVYLPSGTWMDFDTGKIYQGPTTLRGFALPVGKTPLFVGGKGVLVTRVNSTDSLQAEVYPVAPDGSAYRFTHPDGKSASVITTRHGDKLVVRNAPGRDVEAQRDPTTGRVTFPVQASQDYEVTLPRG